MIGPHAEISDEARRILEEWDREAAALEGLVNMLTNAVGDFRRQSKPIFSAGVHAELDRAQLLAEEEFLSFLMHMVSRVSLTELGFGLRDILLAKLVGPTVQAFMHNFAPLPSFQTEPARAALLQQIQEAEVRYGKCTKTINLESLRQAYLDMTLDEKEDSGKNQQYWAEIGLISPNVLGAMDRTYLFAELGLRLIESAGKTQDAKAFVDVTLLSYEICRQIDLTPLVKDFGHTLMG